MVTARDVADFIVYVRDPENNILYQEDFPYNIRKAEIPTSLFKTQKEITKEICVISKDSNGLTGNWFHAQCEKLPVIKEQSKFFNFFSTAARPASRASNLFNNVKELIVFLNLLLIALKVYLL